ncbi:MAG TPA: hypothetical protein IGS37_19030 [Synechococcales cyanobacterium M55_K2018_004]|nr:hypothetical protein [Synechococcales cyanobacterium M55_K2018_004]
MQLPEARLSHSSLHLANALQAALQRGVNVDVVGTGQGLQTLDITWLSQNAQGRIRLFRPKENMADAQRLGSHAKFCVADGIAAYVGSANLTAPGLGRHLEMGLLVQGDEFRTYHELISETTVPSFPGLVLAETVWRSLGAAPVFRPFSPGYVWQAYEGEVYKPLMVSPDLKHKLSELLILK